MKSPQDTNLFRLGKRKWHPASVGGSSSSALQENDELFGDTQMTPTSRVTANNDGSLPRSLPTKDPGKVAISEIYSVLEELPPQREAPSAPLEAEGRPPTGATLEAQGRPQQEFKWNFNLDTPDTPLALPPVSTDWKILKSLPSADPKLPPVEMFRGMEKCIKRHRHKEMVG